MGDGHVRTTTTTYDRAGDAIRVVDPKGQRVETAYDRAGRSVTTAFFTVFVNDAPEEVRESTYDDNGNLLSRTDKNGESTYTYDALNRQITESRNTPGPDGHYTINNFYDGVGNRTKAEYPNPQGNPGNGRLIVSTYDGANRVTSIGDTAGGGVVRTTSFGYDPGGNRLWQVTPQDVMTSASFDALNRVITLSSAMNAGNNDNFYHVQYHYDLSGNRRSADEFLRAHANRHIVWDYDALDRLRSESWTCSGEMDFDQTDQTRSYTYDLAGNRLTQTIDTTPTGGDVVSTSYTYDALNELKSSVTGNVTTSYKYDINGNRSEKNGAEGVLDYLYDTSDRLIKVRRGANTIFTASYDARTRRLSKIEGGTTTLFRYDGGTSFEELDGSRQILKQLVRAGGLGGGIGSILYTDETMAQHPRPVEFYAYDAVGNTVATMTSPDEIAQETVYEAFGNVIQQIGTSTNNRLRNTKERDASIGLDNDGFRYCDPETGRYLQRDPLGYKDGLNVYLSVHDNPVNWVDPQGLSADWKWWGSFVRNSIVETGKTVGGMAASSAQAVLHPIDTAVSAYNGSVNTTSAVMARTLEQGGSTGEAVFNGAAHLIGSATGSEKVGEAIVGVDNVTADELTTTERWTRGAAGASQLSFTAAAALERFGSGSAAAEGGEAAGAGGGDTAGLRPEGCFVAGTMVLSGVGELIPIETMGVGERVATDGGTANSPKAKADADPNATDVHSDWKKLSIDAVRVLPDGTNDVWQVKTLQSPEWIAHHRIRDGSFVPLAEVLDLKEMGLPNNMVGTIESIVAAPAVGKGPGRVVLTTVSHLNDYVFDLVLADQAGNSDNLGVTGFHKFYSEDRHRWISTVDLREGERLRGESGPIHVLSVTSLPGTQRVYNFTVEADHVYYVGDLTALTHNSCPVKPGDTGTYGDLKAKKRASGETEPLHMDHQPSLAAQVEARRNALGRNLTKGELAALKAETPAVASPTQVHQNSPTYGGRNTKAQVAADAVDLGRAATRDRAAFDEAMKNR